MGVQSYGPQNQGVHKWEADDGAPELQAVRNLRWTLTMGLSTWSLCLVVPEARLGGLQLNPPCLWVWHELKFHSCILGNHNHVIHPHCSILTQSFKKPFFFFWGGGGRCYFIGGPQTPVWYTSKMMSIRTVFDSKMNDSTVQRSPDSTTSAPALGQSYLFMWNSCGFLQIKVKLLIACRLGLSCNDSERSLYMENNNTNYSISQCC